MPALSETARRPGPGPAPQAPSPPPTSSSSQSTKQRPAPLPATSPTETAPSKGRGEQQRRHRDPCGRTTGTNDLTGTSPVDSGATLQADTWVLSETSTYGYSASAWACIGGTQAGSQISIGIGREATCTITNDDRPGTIIVKKIVKPTTSTTAFPFATTGTGYVGFSVTGGQQNSQTLNAGTYKVTENEPLGWVLTGIGGSTDPNTHRHWRWWQHSDLNSLTATINLKIGDTVTCVFENTGQGVTRSQGFWATHTPLADIAWSGGTRFGHTFPGVANVPGVGDKNDLRRAAR